MRITRVSRATRVRDIVSRQGLTTYRSTYIASVVHPVLHAPTPALFVRAVPVRVPVTTHKILWSRLGTDFTPALDVRRAVAIDSINTSCQHELIPPDDGVLMATRLDVARLAGTSPALVSYVLNGGPRKVAPVTEARIRAAIEELDYRPNRVARSLRTRRTHTLGIIVPDSANPYFAELANAVEDAASAAGYAVLIGNSAEHPTREQRYLAAFADQQVDGLFLVPSVAHATGEPVALPKLPIVLLDRIIDGVDAPVVAVDNFEAARLAVRHLLDHGLTALACVAGPEGVRPAEGRVEGFRRAVADAGLVVDERRVVRAAFGLEAGYEAARSLVRGADRRPDAIFVASDEQGIGVLKALEHAGIDCPGDIAVVSFDGIASTRYTSPALTTMAQPFVTMGERAVQTMLALIDGEDVTSPQGLSAVLVTRDSCGCPAEDGLL